jgi:hypothetical protein
VADEAGQRADGRDGGDAEASEELLHGMDPPSVLRAATCRSVRRGNGSVTVTSRPSRKISRITSAGERALAVTPIRMLGAMASGSFTISCDDCVARATDACADCVVTFVCDRDPGDAITIRLDEARAVRLLADAGLVPHLRHERAAR